MEQKKMCLGLFSGSVDKLTAAGIILSGAVADDMKVDIYVLLQGARAFRKDIGDNPDKRCRCRPIGRCEDQLAAPVHLHPISSGGLNRVA